MPGQFAGGFNTVIPLFAASGHLQISYGRNPKSYALNLYTAQQTVTQPYGSYLYFDPLDAHRLQSDMKWAYGTPRPSGNLNRQGFLVKQFVCERYSEGTVVEKTAADLADWPLVQRETERLARQIMLNRIKKTLAVITDTTQYASTHVVTATALSGGFLSAGTATDPKILNAFINAALIIQGDTGTVSMGQISALMNNKTANKLGVSREIRDYLQGTPDSYKLVVGDVKSNVYGKCVLPPVLYNFPIVIEDAYANVAQKESSGEALTNLMPDNTIVLFVREGDLEKPEGDAGFSSFTQFVYGPDDMKAEARADDWHRQLEFAVTDNFDVRVTSPQTVVVITNVFS